MMHPQRSVRTTGQPLPALLRAAGKKLLQHGVACGQLEAELILSHLLTESRHHLYVNPERILAPKQLHEFEQMVARRCQREPLQYILGGTEFYGMDIFTTPAALIPRPESELLVEAVIALARRFATPRLVELGTGSGCMALAVAAHVPQADITATDISEAALRLARRNAEHVHLSQRVRWLRKDMLDPAALDSVAPLDIIFSNPPYVLQSERADLEPEIRNWEPEEALYVNGNGLKFYEAIARHARKHLRHRGFVAVEMASQRARQIVGTFTSTGLVIKEILKDYNGQDRHLIATIGSTVQISGGRADEAERRTR